MLQIIVLMKCSFKSDLNKNNEAIGEKALLFGMIGKIDSFTKC